MEEEGEALPNGERHQHGHDVANPLIISEDKEQPPLDDHYDDMDVYKSAPIQHTIRIDGHDNVEVAFFYNKYIDQLVQDDKDANNYLYDADVKWDTYEPTGNESSEADYKRKQLILKKTHFISFTTLQYPRQLIGFHYRANSENCLGVSQHPLLACSREIRRDCLLGYYHYDHFEVGFSLTMGKFDGLPACTRC
jgi:hypothetical protein